MLADAQVEDKTLEKITVVDRCDVGSCGAQAYVRAVGVTGDLLFCAHHYSNIVNNAIGYDKMMKFAYQIVDQRDRLAENRLVEDS